MTCGNAKVNIVAVMRPFENETAMERVVVRAPDVIERYLLIADAGFSLPAGTDVFQIQTQIGSAVLEQQCFGSLEQDSA